MTGRQIGHRRSSLVLFGAFPWSNDVPVLLLNQPNDSKGVDQPHCEGLLHWVYNSWSLARILSETPVPCLWLADYHQEISWWKIAWHWQYNIFHLHLLSLKNTIFLYFNVHVFSLSHCCIISLCMFSFPCRHSLISSLKERLHGRLVYVGPGIKTDD